MKLGVLAGQVNCLALNGLGLCLQVPAPEWCSGFCLKLGHSREWFGPPPASPPWPCTADGKQVHLDPLTCAGGRLTEASGWVPLPNSHMREQRPLSDRFCPEPGDPLSPVVQDQRQFGKVGESRDGLFSLFLGALDSKSGSLRTFVRGLGLGSVSLTLPDGSWVFPTAELGRLSGR